MLEPRFNRDLPGSHPETAESFGPPWPMLPGNQANPGLHSPLSGIRLAIVLVFIGAINVIQLALGANPIILCVTDMCVAAVLFFLAFAPNQIGAWFALVQLLQLFGVALVCKTAMLLPFDSGLLAALPSISLCVPVIVLTGVSALRPIRQAKDYRLAKFYADPAQWRMTGLALLIIGEGATWLNYAFNINSPTSFGGFSPLVHFKIAGTALLANDAMRKGRLMSPALAVAFGIALLDGLLFNSKSEVAFRFAAYGLALVVQHFPWKKKLIAIVLSILVLAAADRIVFPVIHILRTDEFRTASVSDRFDMIRSAFTGDTRYTWKDLHNSQSSTVMADYIQFLSTDDGFINRFGSLGYLDLTVAIGDPNATRVPLPTFLRNCALNALPAPIVGAKENISMADRLWAGIDSRFTVGGFATMGTIASARMTFGTTEGLAITVIIFWIILCLWQIWYGGDIKSPLVQFLLIDSVTALVDGDIQGVFTYVIRFFWQDLLVIWLVGYAVARIARYKQMNSII